MKPVDRDTVVAALRRYISEEILDGDDDQLDESSPLLAWGVLNSLEIVRLLAFLRQTFGVDIDPDTVTPTRFQDISSIAAAVLEAA